MNSPSNSGAKSSLAFLLSVLTLSLAFVASYLCASDPMFRAMMKLSRQADLMSQRYVGDLSPERVFADAWRGMQAAIPFRMELVSDSGVASHEKKLGDWGLLLASDREGTSVVAVTEGSLFSGALQPGDRVTSVGQDTVRLVDKLKQYLTSRIGDSLLIAIERNGVAETVRVVVPDPPRQTTAHVSHVDDVIYCGIGSMTEHLARSLADSLQECMDERTRGVIIDLRSCRDDVEAEAERLAELLLGLQESLPIVLLVDESTGRQGASLVREILRREKVVVAGNLSHPLRVVTEAIPLRSGERLFVYEGERNEDYFYSRDSIVNKSLNALQSEQSSVDRTIIPEIVCDPPELSAMTVELLSRGLMLDFAAASSYRTLPTPEQESEMFDEFAVFLHARGYSYDPLGEAFGDLEISARKPGTLPAVRNIRKILNSQPPARLDELRDEIVPLLLLHLQQVKIGGEPELADRLRMDDYCLKAALAYLKEFHA